MCRSARKLSNWHRSIFLLLALESPVTLPAAEPGRLRAGEGDWEKVVGDLGSESWGRRESAQDRLLEGGPLVAPLLEEAARSANLEQAYRARYILSRVDPAVFECHVIKLELGDAPAIIEVAVGMGPADEEIALIRVGSPEGDPGAEAQGLAYTVVCRTLESERVAVSARQVLAGREGTPLRDVVTRPGAVSILKTSEEGLYRRLGTRLERERRRYITILRLREGRRSVMARPELSAEEGRTLEDLVRTLLTVARTPDSAEARTALDVLARLRVPAASDAFRAALDAPATRGIASLGTDDLALLFETASSPREAPGASLRAAARLLELGDERGLDGLIERLGEGDPAHLHAAMSSLSDHLAGGGASTQGRSRILEAAFSEGFLSRAIWKDMETEHFLSAAADGLEPGSAEDRVLGADTMERLKRLARGELGPVDVRIKTCLELGRRLARRLDPEAAAPDLSFILAVLPALKSAGAFSEVSSLLEECLQAGAAGGGQPGEVGDQDLDLLLETLVAQAESSEAQGGSSAAQALLRVSRVLSPRPGQLQRIVAALVLAAARLDGKPSAGGDGEEEEAGSEEREARRLAGQMTLYLRQLDGEAARWTGAAPVSRPQGGASGQAFRSASWKEWLGDPERIAAREADILAEGRAAREAARAGGDDSPGSLIFYEFDLLISDPSTPKEAVSKDGERAAFEVLDGRRLLLEPARPITYEDRWGNRVTLRIDQEPPAAGSKLPRFRTNLKSYLSLGIPALTAVQGRELSGVWYESSDLFLGSRLIPRRSTSNYRSLAALYPAALERSAGEMGTDVKAHWSSFVEEHLLRLSESPEPQEINGVLSVLRTLRIKECAPLLLQVLKARPTIDVAQQLAQLGDETGLAFLRSEITSSVPQKRLAAALALCEIGLSEGVDAFAEAVERQPAAARGLHYRAASALGAFLDGAPAGDPARAKAIDFFVARLDEPRFRKQAFTIIAREAGNDFGFSAAEALDSDVERTRAVKLAIQDARSWWARTK